MHFLNALPDPLKMPISFQYTSFAHLSFWGVFSKFMLLFKYVPLRGGLKKNSLEPEQASDQLPPGLPHSLDSVPKDPSHSLHHTVPGPHKSPWGSSPS